MPNERARGASELGGEGPGAGGRHEGSAAARERQAKERATEVRRSERDQEHEREAAEGAEEPADIARAGEQAEELAKDRMEERADEEGVRLDPGLVARAAAGRRHAINLLDEQAGAERRVMGATTGEGDIREGARAHRHWHQGRRFTALHSILRDGSPVYPGEEVSFEADDGVHVRDLLDQRHIIEGGPEQDHVKRALADADLARADALWLHEAR